MDHESHYFYKFLAANGYNTQTPLPCIFSKNIDDPNVPLSSYVKHEGYPSIATRGPTITNVVCVAWYHGNIVRHDHVGINQSRVVTQFCPELWTETKYGRITSFNASKTIVTPGAKNFLNCHLTICDMIIYNNTVSASKIITYSVKYTNIVYKLRIKNVNRFTEYNQVDLKLLKGLYPQDIECSYGRRDIKMNKIKFVRHDHNIAINIWSSGAIVISGVKYYEDAQLLITILIKLFSSLYKIQDEMLERDPNSLFISETKQSVPSTQTRKQRPTKRRKTHNYLMVSDYN